MKNKKYFLKEIFLMIITVCFLIIIPNNSYAVEPEEVLKNQKQELRARNISKNVRCMICQNQSIVVLCLQRVVGREDYSVPRNMFAITLPNAVVLILALVQNHIRADRRGAYLF